MGIGSRPNIIKKEEDQRKSRIEIEANNRGIETL